MKKPTFSALTPFLLLALACAANPLPDGWRTVAPRDEIRPVFSFAPKGGPKRAGSLVIVQDKREGLDGWFQKSFAVHGGDYYRFHAIRKTRKVSVPRRSALVRVLWQDEAGRMVSADVPTSQVKELGHVPSAEPEYPADGATDAQGWTTVSGVYRAPAKATRAVVELHLQWAPNGRIEWSEVQFAKTTPPSPRKVRLATVHYKPTGKSSRENCEEYASLIAEAAKQKADLVVLGETVPAVGVKQKPQLAQARACENHVYLVSSTFLEPRHGWMISAVFDQTGKPIAQAEKWGTVAVAEVDMGQPYIGPYNLGDFRAMRPRHRPISVPEPIPAH